jgi:imidazolonepropionase-like amidohydrolase
LEALVSATKNSAQATGILKNQGTIEVGKKNLLFLNSNPIENIEHIDEIYLVVKTENCTIKNNENTTPYITSSSLHLRILYLV